MCTSCTGHDRWYAHGHATVAGVAYVFDFETSTSARVNIQSSTSHRRAPVPIRRSRHSDDTWASERRGRHGARDREELGHVVQFTSADRRGRSTGSAYPRDRILADIERLLASGHSAARAYRQAHEDHHISESHARYLHTTLGNPLLVSPSN